MYLKLLALFTFLSAAFSQAITNVTYTDLLCASSSNTTTLARGATAYLCVHFITYEASSKSYVPQRAVFPLTVDDFTSVQVLGGQSTFTSLGNFSQVVAQVQGIVQSTPLTYYQLANSFYSSAFSIVIQLDMGNITSVIWDHQCATCGSSECYAFTSGSSNIDSICNTPSCVTTNDSSTCDPQIFVTWIGSDVNNVKMTSASMRLSRFRQFSTSELLSASTIPDFVPVVPSANSTNSSSNTTNNTTPSGDDTDNEPNNNNPSGNQNNGQTNTTTNSSNEETDNEPNNNNPSPSENQSASEQQNTQTGSETNGSGTQTETNTNGSGTETSGSGSETGTNTNGSGTETGTNTNGSGTQAGTETNGSGNENGSGTGTGTSTNTNTNTNTNTTTNTNTNTNTNTSGSGNGGTDQSDEEGSGQNNPTPTVG